MNYVGQNQPYDPQAWAQGGGYYKMAFQSGLVVPTLAAGGIIAAIQWKPAAQKDGRTYRFQLKKFRCFVLTTTAFAAAQLVDCYLFKVRGFTGADTGGNQKLPATLDQKVKNGYPDSLFVGGGDIRVASTAALAAGTRTPEALPQATLASFWSAAIGASSPYPNEWTFDEHHVPIILDSGEGLEVQNGTAFGGTGGCKFFFDMEWMEEPYGTHGW